MHVRLLALAAVLLLPLASAGPAPAIGFLADGQDATSDGVLRHAWPDKNESSVRVVFAEMIMPAGFVNAEEPRGTHLQGRMFAGLWPDAGIAKESLLKASLLVDGVAMANATSPVDVNVSQAPDPMGFMPPDPMDPEGAVFHVAAKVLPMIIQPPTLLDFGVVDIEVPEGAEVRLQLGLIGADGGLPTAAAVALKYDGLLSPSFVYLPWYSADPAASSPPQQLEQPQRAPPGSFSDPPAPAPKQQAPSEDSPGIAFVMLGLMLVALAWARRR